MIPSSFFQSGAENNTLQIVVCGVFFAIGILLTPHEKARKVNTPLFLLVINLYRS